MPLLTFLLALALNTAPAHEYHLSKTNLRYVAEAGQVQVEMHLFVEDLELDMVAFGAPEGLELGTEVQHADAEALLERYLTDHFAVTWNATPLPLKIVGYELEDDLHGFWVYLSAEEVPAPAEVEVSSSLLVESFPDQKNIVKIFNGEERGATLLLSKARTEGNYSAE